jgi:tetratricopeptide (TPR) repeat protein
MDWTVEFAPSLDKEDIKCIRETLEAKLKTESGHYGEAARVLWELLVQLRHEKKRMWECITMIHLAKVYRTLRGSIAIHLLEDALELAQALQFKQAKLMALGELGEISCLWGKFEKSLELFTQAFDLLEADDAKNKRLLLLDMAIAYEGLNQLPRAKALLDEVVALHHQLELSPQEVEDDQSHLNRITPR